MEEEIISTIYWTNTAKNTFDSITEYLLREWTEKELTKFVNRTEEVLALIKRYPEMSRPSLKRKNTRIIILNKHAKLVYYYKPSDSDLTLLLFWNMKQNPAGFKY